jgi:hypothetical protein
MEVTLFGLRYMRSYEIAEKFCIVLSQMHEIVDSDEEFRDFRHFSSVFQVKIDDFHFENSKWRPKYSNNKIFFIEANKAQFQS